MSFFLEVVQSAFSPVVLFYMFAGVATDRSIRRLKGQKCGYKDDHALNDRRIG